MGLRINTNVSALTALRTLSLNDRLQTRSLERLSTGLRINRGADDPSGLVISEQLRGQVAALKQAVENSQNASNLINVADSALQEVSNLLIGVQDSVVFALNTGGASPEQIAAEQDAVDAAIQAIDRIASTTRYGDRELLNGSAGYLLVGSEPLTAAGTTVLKDIQFRSLDFAGGSNSRTLDLTLTQNPARAEIVITGVSSAADTILRITGSRGTEDIFLGANAGVGADDSIALAINSVSPLTGVYASSSGAGTVSLFSEDFGEAQLIRIEGVQGSLGATGGFDIRNDLGALVAPAVDPGTAITTGEIVSDRGLDAQMTFVKNEEGKVVHAIHRQGGREFEAPKLEDETMANVDPAIYDAYVGEYDYGHGAILTVTKEGNRLFAQLTGRPKFEIFAKSETEFFWKIVNAQVTFVENEEGKVIKAIHRQGGNELEAPKIK